MRELNINKQISGGTNDSNPLDDFFAPLSDYKGKAYDASEKPQEGDLDTYKDYLQQDGSNIVDFTSTADKDRALLQSNWEQVGNAAKKFLPNVGLELLNQIGGIIDIEDYANTDDEVGNWLSNWAIEQKEKVNEYLPIYRENPEKSLDVSDFAWWVDNGSSLLESATSFVALGYATGGLTLSALKKGGKALEWLKVLNKGMSNSDKGLKFFKGASTVSNAFLLNQAESIGIGINVYKDVYQNKLKEFEAQGKENADELAKEEASKRAASSISFNKINFLLNLTSANLLTKTPLLTRQLRNKASLKKSLKNLNREGLQEAVEETINNISEKQAVDDTYTFNNVLEDVFSKEGLEAALLGYVGGAGQTAITNAGRHIPLQRNENGERVSSVKMQNEAFAEQQAQLKVLKDLNNNIGNDVTDMLMKAEDVFNLKSDIEKLLEEKETLKKNNKNTDSVDSKITSLKQKLTANQAYDNFSKGTTEQFLNIFEDIKKLSKEEAVEKGLEENYIEQADSVINYVTQLEEAYNVSQSYLNKNQVYENKAYNIDLNNRQTKLEDNLPILKETLEKEVNDLGLTIFLEEGEDGTLGVKYNNKFIKQLPSYQLYKSGIDELSTIKEEKKNNLKDYLILISPEYQSTLKNLINKKRVNALKKKKDVEVKKTVKEQTTKKATVEKTFENAENQPTNTETQKGEETQVQQQEETTQNVEEVTSVGDFKFKSANEADSPFITKANELLASENTLETKINKFQSILDNFNSKPNKEQFSGITIQLNNAIRHLQSLKEEKDNNTQQQTSNAKILKGKFQDFAEELDQNPSDKEDVIKQEDINKINNKVAKLSEIINFMASNGFDVTNFKEIADEFKNSIGNDKFLNLFEDFKSVYNLLNLGDKVTSTYEELYFTKEERQSALENKRVLEFNKLLSEFYSLNEQEFDSLQNKELISFIEEQGYKVFSSDNVTKKDSIKTIEAFDKVAHLDKKYQETVKVNKLKFNLFNFTVSKEDVDREINKNVDPILLNPNILKANETIEFRALDQVVYEDGTIVKKDGTINRNGEIEQKNPEDIAPIAMFYKGKQLKGAFLHTTEWVNDKNIAYPADVNRQQDLLREIRSVILKSETGVKTSIKSISNGWFLQDVENRKDTVAKNLPKVTIGIGKDQFIFIDKNNTEAVSNATDIKNGVPYAVMPVNNTTIAIPVEPILLNEKPEYIDSIIEVVKIYIKNDKSDKRRLDLLNNHNLDITTDAGLESYLQKLIYLYPYKKDNKNYYEFNDFKALLNNSKDSLSLIRFIDSELQFGRGLNVGNSIGSISKKAFALSNNSEESLNASLDKLRNVLENTRINVVKNNLKSDFQLPLLTKNSVNVVKDNYSTFIKQNLKTNLYSATLEDGTEVYTVQRSIKFDTEAILNPVYVEDVTENNIEDTGFEDYSFSLDDDLNPIELSNEELDDIKANAPQSLLIKGVPLSTQTDIVTHLASKFLNILNVEQDIQKAYRFLNGTSLDSTELTFKDLLRSAEQFYKSNMLKLGKNHPKYNNAKIRFKIVEALQKDYSKVLDLVKTRLYTINNLDLDLDTLNATFFENNSNIEEVFDANQNEQDVKENNNWNADDVFKEDIKSKMSTNIKNFFTYIEDAQIKDNKIVPIKKFLNINKIKSFDEVVNDLNAILAFNALDSNYSIANPNINDMINVLEEWVSSKPYLKNVINKLKEADEKTKNEFVQVMSKHYTNHVYINNYKNKNYVTNSDNNRVVKIIQQHWLNNIYNSKLVTIENGDYNLNKDYINNLNKDVANLITLLKTDSPDKYKEAEVVLTKLGFDFSSKDVADFIDKGVKYTKIPHSLLTMFTSKEGVFKIYLDTLNNLKGKNISENNPFQNNSVLIRFTRTFAKKNPVYFANSFKDVRGKSYFAYSQNKFLTDRFKTLLTNDSNILEKLSNQPFSSNSRFLKELKDETSDFKKSFSYFTYDGYSTKTYSKKLENSSPKEIELEKVLLFFNNIHFQKDNAELLTRILYPTTSNKPVSYGVQFKTINYTKQGMLNDNGFLTNSEKHRLFKVLLEPEIKRILHLQKNSDRYDIKGYDKGGLMFNFFPELNYRNGDTAILWNKDNTLREDILTDAKSKIVLYTHLQNYINTLVNERIDKWKDYGFVDTIDNPIGDGTTIETFKYAPLSSSLRALAYTYEIGYLEGNVNIFQLFITDPAFYWKSSVFKNVLNRQDDNGNYTVLEEMIKDNYGETIEEVRAYLNDPDVDTRAVLLPYYTKEDWLEEHEDIFNNIGKRLAGDAAPGTDIPDSKSNSFNIAILKDSKRSAYLNNYYKALLGKNANDYLRKVNATDAQEFTTLKEHLFILNKQGKVSQETVTRLLEIEKNNGNFSNEDKKVIFQPLKPVYVQNVWKDGIEHRVYIKSSSFPLYKQLTKNLELDKLRKAMEEQGVDRVAFESAVKVGGVKSPYQIYSSSNVGSINDNLSFNNIQRLKREGFKIQQEVPYDERKQTINDGTQQIKLLTANLRDIQGFKINGEGNYTGREIQNELDIAYKELYKLNYDALLSDLNFDIYEGTLDVQKLADILEKEGLTRGYNLNDIESLKLSKKDNDTWDFDIPLWLNGVSGKLEAMLNSIVDNRVRKLKPKGKSYVLGSAEGFKPILEGTNAQDYLDKTKGIVWDKTWYNKTNGQLNPMRIVDAEGKLYGEEGFNQETAKIDYAEILVPFKFTDNNGNLLDLSDYTKQTENGLFLDASKLDAELLNIFGFRIPTQYLNSMSAIKIVGFLPKNSGDLLIAPADWTVQMGSDFDVDKLYSNSYNTFYNENGKITRYNGEDRKKVLENRVLDLHFSILGNPDIEVQKRILKPLDFGMLKDLGDELYPYVVKRTKGRGITEGYQSWKYLNARAGKAGIGTFSTDNTFIASVQDKDIFLQYYVPKEGYFEYTLELGGQKSNRLSDITVNTKNVNRDKTDVISAFQSLAVDDENEQGLFKLNINNSTFDVIRSLVMLGFEEDIISYFINQPIIRRYSELHKKATSKLDKYGLNDLNKDLFTEFPITDPNYSIPSSEFIEQYGNISKEDLINNIKNYNNNSNQQRAIYKHFNDLLNYGLEIKYVQSTINTHSAGLGKDLFYSTIKERQVFSLANYRTLENSNKLIGEYLTLKKLPQESLDKLKGSEKDVILEQWSLIDSKEDKLEIINHLLEIGYVPVTRISNNGEIGDNLAFIKPTTINGFTSVYALQLNNALWTKYFPYNNTAIKNSINLLNGYNFVPSSIAGKAEASRDSFKSIKRFLHSKFFYNLTDGELIEERNRLLIDTKDNISLANIIHTLKIDKKLENAFINRLSLDIKKTVLPSTITYSANIVENADESLIYASLQDMLQDDKTNLGVFNDTKYTPSKLVQDLVTYSYITNGEQGTKEFIKYLPLNYLKTLNYFDLFKNINFTNKGEYNVKALENQYLQHNPDKVELNKNDLKGLKDSFKFYNNNTIIRRINQGNALPFIFSLKNPKSVSGYDIYFYNNGSNEWEQKDTLGFKNVYEYNGNELFGKTIVPANKVPESNNPILPKTKQDKEAILNLVKETEKSNDIIKKASQDNILDTFNIKENEVIDITKIESILNSIYTKSSNGYNKVFAKELANNLEKFKDYTIQITNSLEAKGGHSLENKFIFINVNKHKSITSFENTLLEELIHAATKQQIINNNTGEVLRLKGLKRLAEEELREYFKTNNLGDFDTQLQYVKDNYQNGLTKFEKEYLYPLINDVEFIGRLFKSKPLQEVLNAKKQKGILNKLYDFIIETLNSFGLNIQKGSALEFALKDIISLINQPPIPSTIQGELDSLNKSIRTPDLIYAKLNLKNEDGSLKEVKDKAYANEIIDYINNNFSNLNATLIDDFIIISNNNRYEQLDLFEDLNPEDVDFDYKEAKVSPLVRSYNNRIKTLEKNIDKANFRKQYDRVEILKDQLQEVIDKRNATLVLTSARDRSQENSDIYYKGVQDLEEVKQMFDRTLTVEDTLYIRKILNFWGDSINQLLSEEEKQSEIIYDDYYNLIKEANKHKDTLIEIEANFMNDFIKLYGTSNISVKDIFNHYKDINSLEAVGLDISRSGNELFDAIFLAIKKANIDAIDESNVIINKVNDLEKKLRPILERNGDKEPFEVFRQRTKNGFLTGHIVRRFTSDYLKRYRTQKKTLDESANFTNFTNFITWAKDNVSYINLNLLIPNKELNEQELIEANNYKEELKASLGERHYNELVTSQQELINEYNTRLEYKTKALMEQYGVDTLEDLLDFSTAKSKLKNWKYANSPYAFYHYLKNGVPDSLQDIRHFNSLDFVDLVPNNPSDYDENYKHIEEDETLLEFYNYYIEVNKSLSKYLPNKERKKLAYYGIPYLEKTILDLYKDKGMKIGLAPILENLSKSVRTVQEDFTSFEDIDPITQTKDAELKINFTQNTTKEIEDYLSLEKIKYKNQTGETPTPAMVQYWREVKIDELSQLKSYNLPKILRVYALTTLAYKHKSKLEDSVQLAQNLLAEQREVMRTAKGDLILDEKGNPGYKSKEESFSNAKQQFNDFIDFFFGNSKKQEGVTNKKILTISEKQKKKEYEAELINLKEAFDNDVIQEEEYIAKKDLLQSNIDSLGGNVVWSKRGDNLLKWVQLVKMGWNAMSSVANVGFGYVANRIEASGGLIYTNENLTKAYQLTSHNIWKNWTFNSEATTTPTAKKIRTLMDKWDVLKDSSHELFQNPFDLHLNKKLEALNPYNLTQRTEFVNQAPVMVAILLSTKVKTTKGEYNLWEILDENGNWNNEYGTYSPENEVSYEEFIKTLRIKIDQTNKMNHGNYDPNSYIALKKTFMGRAISQFRTWMLEGYATRFEGYKKDSVLGERKGRYVSAKDFYEEVGLSKALISSTKGLIRSLTLGNVFSEANFEEFNNTNLKEVDIANMRKVITELGMYTTLFSSYIMLKMFSEGLDDDDDRKFALNMLLNQGMRLKTDIIFYLNPSEFKNLLRDLVPSASIITDFMQFNDAVFKLLQGDDEISTGIYSGNSRLTREFFQLLPFGTQVYKTYNYGIQSFDKD